MLKQFLLVSDKTIKMELPLLQGPQLQIKGILDINEMLTEQNKIIKEQNKLITDKYNKILVKIKNK